MSGYGCFFGGDALDDVRTRRGKGGLTYERLKAAIVADGGFSSFENDTAKMARLLDEICADPELERVDAPFPWVGIKVRA